MDINNVPRVGVGVIVKKENKVLMGKRKGSHDSGTWQFPGGHLDFKESPMDCAIRETKEETDISIKNIELGPYTNDIFSRDNKHYITIFVIADYDCGEVKVMEPEKCDGWEWFEWDVMPSGLMVGINNLKKTNYNPFNL